MINNRVSTELFTLGEMFEKAEPLRELREKARAATIVGGTRKTERKKKTRTDRGDAIVKCAIDHPMRRFAFISIK